MSSAFSFGFRSIGLISCLFYLLFYWSDVFHITNCNTNVIQKFNSIACIRKTSLANRIHYNEADTEDISLKITRRLPLKWLTETFAQEKSFIRTFTHRLFNQKIHRFNGISYNFHWFAIKIDSFALHSSLNRLIFNIFAFSMGFNFFFSFTLWPFCSFLHTDTTATHSIRISKACVKPLNEWFVCAAHSALIARVHLKY